MDQLGLPSDSKSIEAIRVKLDAIDQHILQVGSS